MLRATHRLKLPVSWSKNNSDQQIRTDFFKAVIKKNHHTSSRVGFIISTKVGKATVRNRLRRTLSSLFEQKLPDLSENLDIVFILYPAAAQLTNEEINFNFNKVLSKLSVG